MTFLMKGNPLNLQSPLSFLYSTRLTSWASTDEYVTKMAQATNNNLKVWFEFRGAEFGLAPLTVEEVDLRFWSGFFWSGWQYMPWVRDNRWLGLWISLR